MDKRDIGDIVLIFVLVTGIGTIGFLAALATVKLLSLGGY